MKVVKCEVQKIAGDECGAEYRGGSRVVTEAVFRAGESADLFQYTEKLVGVSGDLGRLVLGLRNLFFRGSV